ncbi:ornithine cyclodeaminase [Halogeometricum pallidum JCM 14848]|uniref:Alanine dehydrogenase n=1 Tax=Halogeometricum pallidum JCM 14848 TaxID=1227487 RepID=M0D4N1_HALPD|nr:ornithine cyclodeaminase family protein [Halogeometricum pallidum]ELZ29808.1 ornithine cyclodeaminase [Halogeometricum pallidum JCM 14848]
MQTLLLNSDDVHENANMGDLVPAIEEAFAAFERGDAQMPPKSYVDLPQYNGDFRSMPAYMDAGEWDAAGIKWVNVHPDNDDRFDLPTVMGTMVYSSPETAFPLAIMDGTELTMKRTGAAAAVATDHLAVEDATSLGIVGAGVQSYTQLEAISTVRDIQEVVVSDLDEERVARFLDAFEDEFDVRAGSIEEAAACDVLSTVTPVESPIVPREAVGEHTHINAMGADAEGKHELADEVLLDAKLVIDDHEQTTHSGEINVPYNAGVLADEDIYGAIGEIVVGEKEGRTAADGISVFDSTGLAIQDVAAAHVVYEHADENDNGYEFDLLGLDGRGRGPDDS